MENVYVGSKDPIAALSLYYLSHEKLKKYVSDGNYIDALKELDVIQTFSLPNMYKSLIHLERARLNMSLKRYPEAIQEAKTAFGINPSLEAMTLIHDVTSKCSEPSISLAHFWDFYSYLLLNNVADEIYYVHTLTEIVLLMVNYKVQSGEAVLIPPKSQLEKVLVQLSKTNDWIAMAFMVLGLNHNQSVLCGAAKNCKTLEISIVPLLVQYDVRFEYWVDRLAAAIIKGGSPIEHLWEICGQPPIHTTAEIAVQYGLFELYTEVAKLSDLNTLNNQGFTVTKYLKEKGYQSNPHYKRIIDINQQIKEYFFSEKAKTAFQFCHYDEALQYYFQILETSDEDNRIGRAKYYRNISLVYSYQNKYEESLEFAEKGLAADPSFGKAYKRKAQVLQVLKRPHLACHTYLTGLSCSENQLEFLKQAVKQLERNVDQLDKYDFTECLTLFQKVESALWSKLLCQAAKDGNWTRIKLVVVGPANVTPLAKDFEASNVSLSTLYDALKSDESLRNSCDIMVPKLLKHGAKIQTLSQNQDEALHILVKLVLLIESFNVLESVLYVLERDPLLSTKNLSLHMVVKNGNLNNKFCFGLVKSLLDAGINPKATDSSGKIASDYITEKFTLIGAMIEIYTPDLEFQSFPLLDKAEEFLQIENYEAACSYYTVSLAVLKPNEEEFRGVLHGKRSRCFLEIKEPSHANTDASIAADSYTANVQMSKVYRHENVQMAYDHLYKAHSLNKILIYSDYFQYEERTLQLVKDLCRMKMEMDNSDLSTLKFKDLLYASTDLMKDKEFDAAIFICTYLVRNYPRPWTIDERFISVECFCSCEAEIVANSKIFGEVLIRLLEAGADLRGLSVYEGDLYLHAASVLASQIGSAYFDALIYVLENRTNRLKEINVNDCTGRTVLCHLFSEPKTEFMDQVLKVLLRYGAQVESSQKKSTLSYLNRLKISDPVSHRSLLLDDNEIISHLKEFIKAPVPCVDVSSEEVDPCVLHCQKLYDYSVKKQKSGADANKTFQSLVELCQKNHNGKLHGDLVSKSIDLIAEQLELSGKFAIPTSLFSMKENQFLKLVLKLSSTKKWISMYQALESYRQKFGGNCLENFASTLTAADYLNSIPFKEQVDLHGKILTCLIDNGATIGKDPQLEKTALEVCIANKGYHAIIILLKNGLDPSELTLSEGDTPLHAAAEIALRKDVGYFDLFEYLLQLHDSDPVKYSYLDISCVDKGQQTLYHVACRIKYSKHSLKLVEILYKRGLPSDAPDAAGKIPYQYISQKLSDRRNGYLVHVSSETVPTETLAKSRSPTPKSGDDDVTPKKSAKPKTKLVKAETKLQTFSIKALLKKKIDSMDDHKCNELHILSFYKEGKKPVENIRTHRAKEGTQDSVDLKESVGSEVDEGEDVDLLNKNAFEDLEWEVECTSDVWKTLHGENMPYKKRKAAIFKIQQLATGNWRSYKKVKDVPQTLKLFTIELSCTSRIVWELAIAFSPRCTDVKLVSDGNEANLESTQGQVYSEVIRVWAIVFDAKDLKRVQDQIVKSHTRGENGLVQKQLESICVGKEHFGDGTQRLPRLFAEKQIDKHRRDLQRFCPPASDRDHEYHIIKFYSFSTALVSSVLQIDSSRSVDFPFQVTELEHRIINISSTAPIILLGRSGTGKTTCCLYRLWMNFVNYWNRAELAEAPLYPTNCVEMRQIEADGEQQEKEIGGDADEDCTADRQKDQFSENPTEEFPFVDEANPDSSHCSDVNADGEVFTHLHQLFITKNGVLCSEVLKNFQKLSHGCEVASKAMRVEDLPLPHTFQEITDNYFPLFLTSKKLWIVLDASLDPPYFFLRHQDGSLKSEIVGWSNEEDHLAFLPSLDDDDNDDENVEDSFALPYEFLMPQSKVADQRKEVTYEVFLQLWPQINKPHSGYHPSLVWTEIISFIKGSFEALNTKTGYLSEEQYISIGRKRAPNFNGERDKIYQLFSRYQREKRQKRLFDESDVVFNLYKRLQEAKQIPCPLHEIYVDETQDFTQAELCLLIQLSENPNQMFLTGDTAQSIMRGVSFRFSELKSLFFYAQEHSSSAKRTQPIHCPKSLYELTHNYRSHQGILKLASSVIDILFRYFSDSFDPMKKDQGLFDGPKPKVLESCSLGNLAMLLRGNKRQTSHIEFGAHQVILVVNNESRDKLPEELSTALVLTIFEAKGLEFDDVLLYNFFQDSQASTEWRVVTEFLQELVNKQNTNDDSLNQDNLIKINMDIFQEANRPRPLAFNSNLHKILNSELKLLYTALTRARVNLWIFDADIKKRAPMFDYFKTLDLVQLVNTENLEEKDMGELIFAEHSTPEMWLERGDELSRRSVYEIAAKCYHLGGHVQQETIALANHQALMAQRCPDLHKRKEHFMMAAELYMDCNQHIKVAKCLARAKEKVLSTQLFEKCQEYEIAGINYLRLQYPLKASQCFENVQQFDRTVDILHDNKMYDRAVDVIQRYDFLVKSYGRRGEAVPEILLKHKPQKDINYLCYQSANSHFKERHFDKMKSVLHQLPSIEKMEFLEKKGLIDLAANMLSEEGQLEESVELLRRNGKYEKCIELARNGIDEMLANCLYTFAQYKYVQLKQDDGKGDLPTLQRETTVLLEEAKACYQRKGDMNGYALCLLRLGIINGDKDSAVEALAKFLLIGPRPNASGCLQSAAVLTEQVPFEEISHTGNIMTTIEMGNRLLKDLKSTASTVSLSLREYLQHSGFHILNNQTVCTFPKLEPLVTIQLEPALTSKGSSSQVEHPIAEIKQMLHRRLLIVIEKLFLWVRQSYMFHLSRSIQCPLYMAGYECRQAEDCTCPLQKIGLLCRRPTSGCLHRHEPYTFEAFKQAVTITTKLMGMDSEFIAQVDEDDVASMEILQGLFDKKNQYSISRLLLLLLTPVAGNGLPFKTRRHLCFMKKWFLSLRKCSVFVRNYLFANWKRVKFHSNRLPNFFPESQILIGLFDLKVFLKLWMNQLCESAHRPLSTHVQRKSVLIFSQNMYFCISERFVESLFCLHAKWDPFEALIKFAKYTTLLLRKDIRDYPRLDVLLFWCEFFVVLALMLILKSQKDLGVALPESYVIHSYFNDCLQKDSAFSLQKAVQGTEPFDSPKIRTLWDRIEDLITLMFQSNMVKIAEKERHITSGVTERYIVLGLVFLSNSSRGVYSDLVPKIIDVISRIGITDKMAPRLGEALQKVRLAKGSLDTVLILKDLLHRRGDSIGQYYWLYNPETQQGLQCQFNIPTPAISSNSVDFDSRTDQRQDFDEENEDESGVTKSELNQAREFHKKMKAVSTISRAYLVYRFRRSCTQLADKVSNYIARESGNLMNYFLDMKLGEASCQICGLSFATEPALPMEMLLEAAMTEEEEHPGHVGGDNHPRTSEMKKHKKKSSHKGKEIELRRCVNKYRQEFAPVVKKAQELLSNYEQEDLNPEIAYDFNKLNKTVTKLDQSIIEMCKEASWGNLPSLETQLAELKDVLESADGKILKKKIAAASAAEVKVESNVLEDEELNDFVDTQDVVQEPRCNRTQTLYRPKNKKH